MSDQQPQDTHIPVLDKQAALQRQEGDTDFLRELWEVFVDDALNKRQQLREALQTEDIDMVEHLAHTLKSGAATVGTRRVRDAAQALETFARQGVGNGELLHARLEQELDTAITRLRKELSQQGQPG
ncbi:MAG: Hpt domain-containing protein [Desulfohalobiaceae bacterium]